jgi:hypothetical protein
VERDARGALDQLQARVVAADEGLERLGVVEHHLAASGLRHGRAVYRFGLVPGGRAVVKNSAP